MSDNHDRELREQFSAVLPAVEGGDHEQKFHLAKSYEHGLGTPQDPEQATRWYRACVEDGMEDACRDLADVYLGRIEAGEAILDQALPWLERAARCGHGSAALFLAHRCRMEAGEDGDSAQNLTWYRLAARDGRIEAMLWLGRLLLTQNPAQRNISEALIWLRQAAEMDARAGQHLLAETLVKEIGSATAKREARFWLHRATVLSDQSPQSALERLARDWWRWRGPPFPAGSACDRLFLRLSDTQIQMLIRELSLSTLIPFMIEAPSATRLALFSNLSRSAAELLRMRMTEQGDATPRDIVAARKTIIATVRRTLGAEIIEPALAGNRGAWLAAQVGQIRRWLFGRRYP